MYIHVYNIHKLDRPESRSTLIFIGIYAGISVYTCISFKRKERIPDKFSDILKNKQFLLPYLRISDLF
jgi:hypothetical protein